MGGMSQRARLTVGSMRGVPQAARPAPRRSLDPTPPARPKGCCGSGCAGCPFGQIIRARMGLPQVVVGQI